MTVPDNPGPDMIDITPTKDGGLLKQIVKEGEGTEFPEDGDEVFVYYTGTLQDGTQFDSNKGGDAFSFSLGKGMVIKGWEVGVATMKKGEVATLTCSPDYAYGESGSPPKIPPNATLIFEVELLYWKVEDLSPQKDGGISRHYVVRGHGHRNPIEGSPMEVHLTGKYKGKVFEDRDVSYNLGDGDEHGVCYGVDIALKTCKIGDKVRLNLSPKYAFGSSGNAELEIPPNAEVEYEVSVKNFVVAKEPWELSVPEKLSQSALFKEKGTNLFKKGQYELAVDQYKKIVDFLETETASMSDEETSQKTNFLLVGHLNMAACYLKLNDLVNVKEHSDKALIYDNKNEKALFRRGQALLQLHDPEQAKLDFTKVLEINPDNKAAATQIKQCNASIKKQKEQDKKLYANMFEKFAKIDKKKEDANIAKQPDCLTNPGEWDNANGTPEILSSDGINLQEKMNPKELEEWDRECESEEEEKSDDKQEEMGAA